MKKYITFISAIFNYTVYSVKKYFTNIYQMYKYRKLRQYWGKLAGTANLRDFPEKEFNAIEYATEPTGVNQPPHPSDMLAPPLFLSEEERKVFYVGRTEPESEPEITDGLKKWFESTLKEKQ